MDMYMQRLAEERLIEIERLTKERDEALEKLAAMESQEPAQWVCELSSNPWPNGGGTRRDTKEEALAYINSEYNHCKYDTVSPIYRLPVPADKAAVAVPVGWKEIVEAVAHIGVDFGYGAFVLSQEHINKARELLAATPSHSQQSAPSAESMKAVWVNGYETGHNDGIGCGHDLAPRCRHAGEEEFDADEVLRLIDRCPSHESEQGVCNE